MTMKAFVSVIVATRNREGLLAQTLDALAGQRWPRDRFEIVVADNGSTDRTREVVDAASVRPGAPPIRYLFVSEPGKSHAVNAALAAARGGIITLKDLAHYQPEWRTPVKSEYRGNTILSMPPASSGGITMTEALNILEQRKITSIVVVDGDRRVAGVVHLHDLWHTEMF